MGIIWKFLKIRSQKSVGVLIRAHKYDRNTQSHNFCTKHALFNSISQIYWRSKFTGLWGPFRRVPGTNRRPGKVAEVAEWPK